MIGNLNNLVAQQAQVPLLNGLSPQQAVTVGAEALRPVDAQRHPFMDILIHCKW